MSAPCPPVYKNKKHDLKPIEVSAAEKLKKQVEEYIKKRIEHLEVMRDQTEKVQNLRNEKQASLLEGKRAKRDAIIKAKKTKAAIKIQALVRGFFARRRLKDGSIDMRKATQLADNCLTHVWTLYH